MRPLLKPIMGLAVLAAIAGIVGLLLAAMPAEKPAAEPEPVLQSVQAPVDPDPAPKEANVSPPAEESEWPIENATVEDLVSGILQARGREDRAWLARTMESTAGKPGLVEDDLLAAYRQYMWRSTDGLWSRVIEAWTNRTYEVVEEGDKAQLVLEVGGSLGELRLPFVRIDGAWYYAGI